MSPFSMGTTPLHHPDEDLQTFTNHNSQNSNVYANLMNPPRQMSQPFGSVGSSMMSLGQPPTPVS